MNEFENIQRLIRLKRFEQPEEGFTEKFLERFHQRQREEMLKKSSVELLMERVTTWWEHLMVPKWSLAAAAVAVCAVSVWLISQPAAKPGATVTEGPIIPEKPFVPKMDLRDLPMARMAEEEKVPMNDLLLRNHVEVRPVLEGKVPPPLTPVPGPSTLPTANGQKPTVKNATPAVQSGNEGRLGK
ncbi:hypothetical protein [Prosthecobacter sp.]|uniref:hypothetical protein n=1 Tax=Prosthecobacter sp. TaxID=1965333 RepID=UPI003783A495